MNQTAIEGPQNKFIKGHLEPYYEQGWEGAFDYTFVPDANRQAVNGGRGYFLASGDILRIFQSNGVIAWEGELNFVRSQTSRLLFPDRHRLDINVWSSLKQKDVSYADWVGWFWATPRLQAEFYRNEGKLLDI